MRTLHIVCIAASAVLHVACQQKAGYEAEIINAVLVETVINEERAEPGIERLNRIAAVFGAPVIPGLLNEDDHD